LAACYDEIPATGGELALVPWLVKRWWANKY
jgi:hypothetical protein